MLKKYVTYQMPPLGVFYFSGVAIVNCKLFILLPLPFHVSSPAEVIDIPWDSGYQALGKAFRYALGT